MRSLILIPIPIAFLVACGGGGGDDTGADAIACARFQGGPFQTLVPGATRQDAPAALTESTIAYRVTDAGFLVFGTDTAGDFGIYLDAAISVEVTDTAAAVVTPLSTEDSGACTEIARKIVVPLTADVYFLELSAAATLVVAPVALDADE